MIICFSFFPSGVAFENLECLRIRIGIILLIILSYILIKLPIFSFLFKIFRYMKAHILSILLTLLLLTSKCVDQRAAAGDDDDDDDTTTLTFLI